MEDWRTQLVNLKHDLEEIQRQFTELQKKTKSLKRIVKLNKKKSLQASRLFKQKPITITKDGIQFVGRNTEWEENVEKLGYFHENFASQQSKTEDMLNQKVIKGKKEEVIQEVTKLILEDFQQMLRLFYKHDINMSLVSDSNLLMYFSKHITLYKHHIFSCVFLKKYFKPGTDKSTSCMIELCKVLAYEQFAASSMILKKLENDCKAKKYVRKNKLKILKELCRKDFRNTMLQLHPDKNKSCVEYATNISAECLNARKSS